MAASITERSVVSPGIYNRSTPNLQVMRSYIIQHKGIRIIETVNIVLVFIKTVYHDIVHHDRLNHINSIMASWESRLVCESWTWTIS